MSDRTIRAVDLFCGSGGTSTGLIRACERAGHRVELTAVNHWPTAIETHSANHPWARHECARIDQLDPRAVAPKGRIDVLVASPECTHFSRARGKAPKNDQSRASGWDVLRWVERLCPREVILENVEEWKDWGPCHATTGEPIESKRGETFAAFVGVLESLGYRVEWRVLNAADFGEATTRRRLFMRARRGRLAPVWPAPTHAESPEGGMFDLGQRWRPAREIIDWAFPSRSIFGRRVPLKPKTLARIERGIADFWGEYAEPFLVLLRGTGTARSVDLPVPALTANGEHVALVDAEPFLVPGYGEAPGQRPRVHGTNVPVPVIPATGGGKFGLCEPFMIGYYGHDGGRQPRVYSVDRPMPTQPTENRFGVVEPFVAHVTHGGRTHSVDSPLPTVTGANRGELAVVEPFLLSQASLGAPRPVSKPCPTIVTDGAVSMVEPLLVSYYGNGGATRVGEPVPTVTTKDRFALLEGAQLDIRFRMLQPHELAAAMGFPRDYRFAGKRGDVVKQIGNAVAVGVAEALVSAALTEVA